MYSVVIWLHYLHFPSWTRRTAQWIQNTRMKRMFSKSRNTVILDRPYRSMVYRKLKSVTFSPNGTSNACYVIAYARRRCMRTGWLRAVRYVHVCTHGLLAFDATAQRLSVCVCECVFVAAIIWPVLVAHADVTPTTTTEKMSKQVAGNMCSGIRLCLPKTHKRKAETECIKWHALFSCWRRVEK